MSTVRIVTGRPCIASTARAVGLELLVLAGQVAVAVHEQELAAEQADAGGARLERRGGVLGQLDVGQQLDRCAVERDGRRVAQARQALALELALALA